MGGTHAWGQTLLEDGEEDEGVDSGFGTSHCHFGDCTQEAWWNFKLELGKKHSETREQTAATREHSAALPQLHFVSEFLISAGMPGTDAVLWGLNWSQILKY